MTPGAGPSLADISLRERESGLLAGGTQVGKSELSDWLGADFIARYYKRGARELVSDTKPRYQAQYLPNGMPAAKLYKGWDHGAYIPGSYLARSVDEMHAAYKLGARTVIVSTEGWEPVQDECVGAFLRSSRRGRPQLVRVDETCDHFSANGMPRGRGSLIVVSRAGAERGCAGLFCTQRTKGISPHLLEQMRRLWCFRLDNRADAKRFQEFGCPDFDLPVREHEFRYWWKGDYHRVWGPYKLELPGRRA